AQLIDEYGSLEVRLERAAEIRQPKRREALIANAELARISMRLVTLDRDVPLNEPIDRLGVRPVIGEQLISFLKAMEFTTLTGRVAAATGVESGAVEASGALVAKGRQADAAAPVLGPDGMPQPAIEDIGGLTPSGLAAARAAAVKAVPFTHSGYEVVTTEDRLWAWVARATELGVVAVDTETTSLDPMQAELVGVSLAVAPNEACYIPLGHRGEGDGLFTEGLLPGQLEIRTALAILKPLLEDRAVLKVAQNLKYDWLILARYGIDTAPFDDTMLISYVLDAGRGTHGMDPLSEKWLGHKPISFDDVTGKGKSRITFDRVPIERASEYAAEDADVTLRLWQVLKPRLAAEGMATVYE
ncbi:MAG: DNA polymerase I, partial [Rhizobiales bacterium]|nr:DNA polymerase I [Hyphomicrobiales bacterium]